MKSKALIVFSLVALFAATGKSTTAPSVKETLLHHFDLSCDSCHASQSTNALQGQISEKVGELKDDVNRLCTAGCHDFDPALSHPVGVGPKGAVPADMPLDSQSRMTCLTCHQISRSSSNSIDSKYYGQERYLYLPQGIQFCGTCHMNAGNTRAEQSHWQISAKAHLGPENAGDGHIQQQSQLNGDIDAESRQCLSCHDNITVTIPALDETRYEKAMRWRDMSDHPIGMDYRQVALRDSKYYKFPVTSEGQMRFFDGRMGCGSCHNPYSQTENYLVVPYEQGLLCRQCHIK